MTSDNYDDSEKKVTGGRNGYGAKLTNIFSKKFEIECADSERKKKYHQIWEVAPRLLILDGGEGNMGSKQKPKITSHSGESFTKSVAYGFE